LQVALVLVIVYIALPGRMCGCGGGGNEASAIASLKVINSAQSTFSSSCGGNGYAQSLEDLRKPPAGSTAGFIAPDLSRNGVIRSGYVVTLMAGPGAETVTAASQTCNGSETAAVSRYFAEVHPLRVGETGQRSFATDNRGTIYYNNTGQPIPPDMAGASVLQ